MSDPVRLLQTVARDAFAHLEPDDPAERVIVIGRSGKKLDLPCGCPRCGEREPAAKPTPVFLPGWSFTEVAPGVSAVALYDGKPVAQVPSSRVKLLRVLFEAEEPMQLAELSKRVYGPNGDPENARHHVRKLRDELQKAFEYEGDPVPNDGKGYRLALR